MCERIPVISTVWYPHACLTKISWKHRFYYSVETLATWNGQSWQHWWVNMDTFCFQRVVSDDSKAQVEASLSLVLPKAHYSIGGIWNSHNCTTKNMTANPIMRILSCLITTRVVYNTTLGGWWSVFSTLL